ncbi:MAG: beta-ketoacyl synthase [Gammaproteobacteria bacterium]|nr:MAG: beta-ketoacyl synthase [Gammaproteobacteria bacterium]
MRPLPVITGFGGVNAAGRSGGHHGYRRMVIDALPAPLAAATWQDLAALTGQQDRDWLAANSLVRKIGPELFDTEQVPMNRRLRLQPGQGSEQVFVLKNMMLPEVLPAGWQVKPLDDKHSVVTVQGDLEVLLPDTRSVTVRSAGQLPTGFQPDALYASRNHPRGIQMTVYGASDALGVLGIDWEAIRARVPADQVSVYAGSGMSQLDPNGNGGMMTARLMGKKVTSKHCPFGFAEMPADFINAYLLGSLGNTGTSMGACASFLYNLRMGIADIQSGRARVAIVGNSEAPITPEVMEGYAAMGALATDQDLLELDGRTENPDHRRACRPFSTNRGFTIAESAQFIVLMDDALAMEMGATIYGAVSDVFVNADGFKKSISAPGVGNYLTMFKATAAARALIGEKALRERSFVQAHGTGTPQNRVTESHILNETARLFGIEQWVVSAVKSYLGHSIGAAAGDQVVATLGVWAHGIIPGISTIDHVADDVHASHLKIQSNHHAVGEQGIDAAIINAKGFGGNNASACVLAPQVVKTMLAKRHGAAAMKQWQQRNETVSAASAAYDDNMRNGRVALRYLFDHGVLDGDNLQYDAHGVQVPGYEQRISLDIPNAYNDMIDQGE